jgi:hypothetical protein
MLHMSGSGDNSRETAVIETEQAAATESSRINHAVGERRTGAVLGGAAETLSRPPEHSVRFRRSSRPRKAHAPGESLFSKRFDGNAVDWMKTTSVKSNLGAE